ncbi:NAD(P)H-binding protein [Hymenobacter sp. BT730]|uniref:NAD(P)H-binding protein n=1 Tax=Hymenobacter sp. BT730 TaxID=3063332 RepID=UPI0026DEB6A5|nr:NAD(P)H-binding protein [Hymenobacter sp. BT730]
MLPYSSTSVPVQTVAVLGCGWLGFPLAKHLLAHGYTVGGTTTTPARLPILKEAGIQAHLLQLSPTLLPTDSTLSHLFSKADTLILNVPPRAKQGIPYLDLLRPVAQAAVNSAVRQILFVSSTGVYADADDRIQEPDAVATADAPTDMLQAEYMFQNLPGISATIVRLAGLMGPNRAPGRFLAGRQQLPHGSAPVNLIHLADCIGILHTLLKNPQPGQTFNACAEHHPPRQEFYPVAAQALGLDPPTFAAETQTGGKIIDSRKLRAATGYQFLHDDVVAALAFC